MTDLTPRQLHAHAVAEARGDLGYIDPHTGLFVMTSRALRERGFCCDNGCRHCPYRTKARGP